MKCIHFIFKESFFCNDEPEEDTQSINESKNIIEPNHQTVDTEINFVKPEHFEPRIVSTDVPYIESKLLILLYYQFILNKLQQKVYF